MTGKRSASHKIVKIFHYLYNILWGYYLLFP